MNDKVFISDSGQIADLFSTYYRNAYYSREYHLKHINAALEILESVDETMVGLFEWDKICNAMDILMDEDWDG